MRGSGEEGSAGERSLATPGPADWELEQDEDTQQVTAGGTGGWARGQEAGAKWVFVF